MQNRVSKRSPVRITSRPPRLNAVAMTRCPALQRPDRRASPHSADAETWVDCTNQRELWYLCLKMEKRLGHGRKWCCRSRAIRAARSCSVPGWTRSVCGPRGFPLLSIAHRIPARKTILTMWLQLSRRFLHARNRRRVEYLPGSVSSKITPSLTAGVSETDPLVGMPDGGVELGGYQAARACPQAVQAGSVPMVTSTQPLVVSRPSLNSQQIVAR
jgi:hypothetical protein